MLKSVATLLLITASLVACSHDNSGGSGGSSGLKDCPQNIDGYYSNVGNPINVYREGDNMVVSMDGDKVATDGKEVVSKSGEKLTAKCSDNKIYIDSTSTSATNSGTIVIAKSADGINMSVNINDGRSASGDLTRVGDPIKD
jgi:hypothetical protein